MSEPFPDDWGVEVWRGGVSAWECDQFGHMNVRFYLARAAEGLAGLAAAMALPDVWKRQTSATVRPLGWHVRYLREAAAGAPLRLAAGLTAVGDDWADAVMVMTHPVSGEPAATFRTRLAHVTADGNRRFAWPSRSRAAALGLQVETPSFAEPRGLNALTYHAEPDTAAETATPAVRGVFQLAECDAFGHVRSEAVVARDVDGGMAMGEALAAEARRLQPDFQPPGRAVVEYRIRHYAWPCAGDGFVGLNGVSRVDERMFRTTHRLIDPASGRAWATSETLVAAFDLKARRTVKLQPPERDALEARLIAGAVM